MEQLTYDQLLILCGRKADLKAAGNVVQVSVDELRAMGKVAPAGNKRSLVQRMRAEKAKQQEPQPLSKRERRRQHGEAIKAARARGEKI